MAFITRTRIRKVGALVGGVQTAITPTTLRTVSAIVETVAEAVALVPAVQRPPADDWWMYALQWEVRSHVRPTIRGVVQDTTRLVFDVDFWETEADQQAGQEPTRRNTFLHEFTPKSVGGAGQAILASIDAYLLSAEFGGFPADDRDPSYAPDAADPLKRLTTDPAHDPMHLLTRQAIASKDGAYRTLPAQWVP